MAQKYGAVDKYIYEEESEEIGGTIVFHYGEQGASKTTSLWQTAKIDVENGRTPIWRGQDTCQWIGLAAQDIPVTLWMHETVENYEFYLTGDRENGQEKQVIDLEEMEALDVRIKTFEDPKKITRNGELDRAHVYFIPGSKSSSLEDRYFFYDMHRRLFEAFNQREYGNHLVWYCDETGDVLPPETKQPFYHLIYFVLPKLFGNFRKNNVSAKGAAHDTSEIFFKFRDKSNAAVYHSGATVKHKGVRQDVVNKLGRGQVVVVGGAWERLDFEIPYLPHETIPWLPENNSVKLRMKYEAEIPDVLDDEVSDDNDQSIQQVKRDTKVSTARKLYSDEKIEVSQRDLARIFDVSRPTIQDWVNT